MISCIEIPFNVQTITSRKMKSGKNNILERLNKRMTVIQWLYKFPNATINHHIFTSSDHFQVTLNFDNTLTRKAPPFRFKKMWCLREDFYFLIKKGWCTKFVGSDMIFLVIKCKFLKEKPKVCNRARFYLDKFEL